ADGESENHKGGHGGELGPGGNILQQRAPAQADDIHVSKDGDQKQAEHMRPNNRHAGEQENEMVLRNNRKYLTRVRGGSDREGGDGAAVGDGEQHPSVKKGDEVAVSFAKINVLPARRGKQGPEFSEGGTAEQRTPPADHPHQQKEHGLWQRSSNVFRGEEDRRADDAAD